MGRYPVAQSFDITDEPSRILASAGGVVLSNRRSKVVIQNTGDNTVYVGGEDVTYDTGFPIGNKNDGANSRLDLGEFTGELWAVTQTGTSTIKTMEVS